MARIAVIGLVLAAAVLLSRPARADSSAFFYGPKLPSALLQHFDRVVVEPDHFGAVPSSPRAQVFAYVSVGEVNRSRAWHKDVPRGLVIGANGGWGSDIVDTRRPEWRTFLLDRVVEPLWAKGYRGFFFDTLDSYERTTTDAAERQAHAKGIAAIAAALKQRHPDAKILFNRGFDVLPLLGVSIDGLVAESLYQTWDASTHQYRPTTNAESDALARRLEAARARHLPVSVIDYVAPDQIELRRQTARRILSAGYEPWVAAFDLGDVGVGSVEIIPRKIVVLYKSGVTQTSVVTSDAVLLGPVLDWLGYAAEYDDLRQPLPADDPDVAGVVVFAPEGTDDEPALRRWISAKLDRGVRIAFVEGFGFDPDASFLLRLGLSPARTSAKGPMTVAQTSDYFGFESPVRPHLRERPPVIAANASQSLLRLADSAGGLWDAGVVGPWGGVAFAPYVISEGLEEERRWILDPFRFIQGALALPAIPAPDVTTESGRRILTVHIDGDAFVSRAERPGSPFCGEVVLDEVLRRYHLPHSVSVIEGEVGPAGLYPKDSPRLEAIARSIFALPNVELGTHLYSHPFEWHEAETGQRGPPLPFLPIPNYRFDLNREIRGSIDYINQRLAPPGKRVKLVQWSGDCLPSAHAVAASQAAGVLNVNGGGATRVDDTSSLTRGSGMGALLAPGHYQVFAPVENENVYTNDWRGPFYGYRHAIQTFALNDRVRRLSTIPLYYHFYSAAKAASLEALHEVYRWALAQETTPLYMSEYAAKVLAFQKVTLARRVDRDAWEIGGYDDLHTVRLPATLGWPDVRASTHVAGVRDVPQGRYVHLAPGRLATIALSGAKPQAAYLESANAELTAWKTTEHGAELRLAGHVPLAITVGSSAAACTLTPKGGAPVAGRKNGALFAFSLTTDSVEASLDCR